MNLGDALYELSDHLARHNESKQVHGCLGGAYGYGQEFENDVFAMHPYCWCEKDECLLCGGDAPNFHYKPSGFKVTWYKYIGRGMQHPPLGGKATRKMLDHCIESIGRVISDEEAEATRRAAKIEGIRNTLKEIPNMERDEIFHYIVFDLATEGVELLLSEIDRLKNAQAQ